ncbi:MAG: L-histidine N(alpha)-methyltransferase [Chromatiaceae bacterium]|jgi:dimethylhistidine N-methyltransferase
MRNPDSGEAAEHRTKDGVTARVHFHDLQPPTADMHAEVLAGLALPDKRIPPKFFYDAEGSRLFDAICNLPEYYPTRTEIGILRRYGAEMATRLGRDVLLVELGSGSSLKIRILLDALRPAAYMPVDISKEHLLQSANALAAAFPSLQIHAVCADYSAPFRLPVDDLDYPRAAFFPGSSVGNFDPGDAERFLRSVGDLLGGGGRLLIGVDLVKDHQLLEAAYNDADGVTAAFNLNLLAHINRELDADFDLSGFRHKAFFDPVLSRIEMHLVSRRDQRAQVAGQTISLASGESIHTENSYKYSIEGFQALARRAGFEPEQVWTDPAPLFSVHCLVYRG